MIIELEKEPTINQFYWFTSKRRPPSHVVYNNSENQFFGFKEVPPYKFIELHDLRFITHATLDELIEQFR